MIQTLRLHVRVAVLCGLLATTVAPLPPACAAPDPYAEETREERDARMAWWRDARFGMFIHWGVYAVPAGTYRDQQIGGIGEWIMNRGKIPVAEYKEFAERFNPVQYDPDAWVRMAKDAGMRYIVITSKHHDGFALFDSKVTDWDVVDATPYGKDLLKPLAAACRKHGLRLGFYYSQAQDWCHPGGAASGGHWDPAQDGDMTEYIRTIAEPQLQEILGNYGPLAVLWWDTPTDMNPERAERLLPHIRMQPGIITNNRLGGGYRGDTDTPEQHIPATGIAGRDWETCMTLNDTWGFKSYDDNWKPTRVLIQNLIDIASKGGNYLLNVGPTAEGLIPQPSVERLQEVGRWMKVNGEAIYGTSASPFTTLAWGRCTKKVSDNGVTLYLHVFDWPENGRLLLPGLSGTISGVHLLDGAQRLRYRMMEDGVGIRVPATPGDTAATVVVVEITGDWGVRKVLPKAAADGSITLPAQLADLHHPGNGQQAQIESTYGEPSIGFWLDARAWIEFGFQLDSPGTYELKAVVATPSENSRLTFAMGDEQVVLTVPRTGDYASFQTVPVGRLTMSEAGIQRLSIKPVAKDWSPVNLRAVVLRPAG